MKLPNLSLFRRTFVSLVITPNQLKAIKINTKTNTVVKFAQVNIPPGVIVNYQIKDNETLVKLIRDLWSKNNISEKYVGVVVPEFSTYTKGIELPNLTDTEIREALTWKIQEYLPVNIDEVIFDWKITKREKDKVEVLVVAILKEVLFSYVDAVASAGLSPIVVETTSLAIQRIIDGDPSGKLIIYVSTSESILVVTANSEIVASSVVTSGNFENIVSTAHQMLTHYSSFSIDKVIISGVGFTQDLVQFLSYNLGRSVQFADLKVKGMSGAQVQDYLVGISLQSKDAAAPESEFTINLLPPAWAEFYKKQSRGIREWSMSLIAAIVIWATFLSVFIVFMFMSLEIQNLQNGKSENHQEVLNAVATEVKNVNTLADSIITFESSNIPFQKVINLLSSAKTDGVTINFYRVNMETGEVVIAGNAQTRTNLLAFNDSLEEKEELDGVSLPITTLVQESNINFEVRAVYKDLVPQKKQQVKIQR